MQAVLRADEPHVPPPRPAPARATQPLRVVPGRRAPRDPGRDRALRFLLASLALHLLLGTGLAWRLSRTSHVATRPVSLGMFAQPASAEAGAERPESEPPDMDLLALLPELVAPPPPPSPDPSTPDALLPTLVTGEELVLDDMPPDQVALDALADSPRLESALRRLRPRRAEPAPPRSAPPALQLRTVPTAAPAPNSTVAAAEVVAAKPDRANRPPPYPARLVARGWRGSVVLRITVDAQGLAAEVLVVTGSGYTAVDALASEAAWRWRFTPATTAGRPSASVVVQRIRFEP